MGTDNVAWCLAGGFLLWTQDTGKRDVAVKEGHIHVVRGAVKLGIPTRARGRKIPLTIGEEHHLRMAELHITQAGVTVTCLEFVPKVFLLLTICYCLELSRRFLP